MKKILFWLRKYYPFLILLLVELLLFLTNYTRGTYLVGWDNLFPELNFGLNIKRSFFAIWQEYRGLGVIDGMSHAANLVHYFFLLFLSTFLPPNLLRYVFVFLMHFLGGLGAYLLISKGIKNKAIALLGALFYQYNFVTIQMFYLPFELFVAHFAALPWALYLLQKYLDFPSRKNLLFFALVSFLATPQAHVPSVFIVFAFCLGTVLLFNIFQQKTRIIKSALLVILMVILTNSFWGIPYFYATFTSAKTIAESKNNQMATDDIYLRNKAFGNFSSVARLQGLTLDYVQYDFLKKDSAYMMQVWRDHDNLPAVWILQWIIFFITLAGLLTSLIKRQKAFYPFVSIFIVIFLIMGNDIPILSLFSSALNTFIPYFYNVFRFVFTKFSIVYALMYSLFLAYGLSIIFDCFENFKKDSGLLIIGSFIGALIYLTYPSFKGNFIYQNLRVKIPNEYFSTFDYFKKQDPNQRIAIFPIPWYWAWTQYDWGTIGSGFIWYGLPQALIDRAFDPWSNYNENFYWEISKALYSEDLGHLLSILEKYQVNWLLIDNHIINPSAWESLYLNRLTELLAQTEKVELEKNLGQISIYKVNLDQNINKYISLYQNLPIIEPVYNWSNYDQAYLENGDYISSLQPNIYYPFRSLFSGRKQEELEFKVTKLDDYFIFNTNIPKELAGNELIIPSFTPEEFFELPQIFLDGELIEYDQTGKTIRLDYIKQGELTIKVPINKGEYSYDSLDSEDLSNRLAQACDRFNQGIFTQEIKIEQEAKFLRFTSIGSSNCFNIYLPNLSQKLGYLISVKNRNIQGRSLLFNLINDNSTKSDLETYLPKNKEFGNSYFVISPMDKYGLGYSLYFNNNSIGRDKTVNDLAEVTVNPIPYYFLTSLKIISLQGRSWNLSSERPEIEVSHPNPSYYQIKTSSNGTLVLSQSYDKGWKAYQVNSKLAEVFPFIFGKEIKNHVLVNNWENGWSIDPELVEGQPINTIVIYYLPQLLEYLGFAILALGVLSFFLVRPHQRTNHTV